MGIAAKPINDETKSVTKQEFEHACKNLMNTTSMIDHKLSLKSNETALGLVTEQKKKLHEIQLKLDKLQLNYEHGKHSNHAQTSIFALRWIKRVLKKL